MHKTNISFTKYNLNLLNVFITKMFLHNYRI